ncbi:hypothetical protein [Clostridium sp. HBUAS56017]|uniref:hypothetical protein n=1 Tax=Clostridium sp. HBUAS56017 TaxID=2571128 RepID=UPI00163D8751|nr:hypothetical protein [Clostridium sp. HBUAS56017]
MVKCPIINKEIDIGECVVIVDVSEGCIKENMLPSDVKKIIKWREICKKCEYHNN